METDKLRSMVETQSSPFGIRGRRSTFENENSNFLK